MPHRPQSLRHPPKDRWRLNPAIAGVSNYLAYPGKVEPTNNGSERLLRPAVVQRKVTNGYPAMWAAEGEAAIRNVVDTARLTGSSPFSTVLKTIGA